MAAAYSANKTQADSLISELFILTKDIPHIHNPLKEVEKLIKDFEYKEVINKINVIIQLLDLEKT